MSIHEQKWMDTKKKKKIWRRGNTSHVGKSTTQTRRTKYLKNGSPIEDYNASWKLKVWASRIPGAVYDDPFKNQLVGEYRMLMILRLDPESKQ